MYMLKLCRFLTQGQHQINRKPVALMWQSDSQRRWP